jgi:hypothetical protein
MQVAQSHRHGEFSAADAVNLAVGSLREHRDARRKPSFSSSKPMSAMKLVPRRVDEFNRAIAQTLLPGLSGGQNEGGAAGCGSGGGTIGPGRRQLRPMLCTESAGSDRRRDWRAALPCWSPVIDNPDLFSRTFAAEFGQLLLDVRVDTPIINLFVCFRLHDLQNH